MESNNLHHFVKIRWLKFFSPPNCLVCGCVCYFAAVQLNTFVILSVRVCATNEWNPTPNAPIGFAVLGLTFALNLKLCKTNQRFQHNYFWVFWVEFKISFLSWSFRCVCFTMKFVLKNFYSYVWFWKNILLQYN